MISSIKNSSADDAVVFLAKDKPAPYSGILFTEEKAKELRLMLVEVENYKTLITSYERTVKLQADNIDLQIQKVNLLNDQNIKLNEALNQSKSTTFWERAGWYIMGGVSIALGGFIYSKMSK